MLRLFASFSILALFSASPVLAEEEVRGNDSSKIEVAPEKKLTPAQRRADELDKLFAELLKTDALSGKGQEIEARILALWMRSDSITGELILAQATKAVTAQEYDTALTMFNELVAAMPDYSEVYSKRAALFYKMQRYDQALADIERVLDMEPRHFEALAGRGMIYDKQGKPDAALAAFREALQMNPHMTLLKEMVKVMEKQRPEL